MLKSLVSFLEAYFAEFAHREAQQLSQCKELSQNQEVEVMLKSLVSFLEAYFAEFAHREA